MFVLKTYFTVKLLSIADKLKDFQLLWNYVTSKKLRTISFSLRESESQRNYESPTQS